MFTCTEDGEGDADARDADVAGAGLVYLTDLAWPEDVRAGVVARIRAEAPGVTVVANSALNGECVTDRVLPSRVSWGDAQKFYLLRCPPGPPPLLRELPFGVEIELLPPGVAEPYFRSSVHGPTNSERLFHQVPRTQSDTSTHTKNVSDI